MYDNYDHALRWCIIADTLAVERNRLFSSVYNFSWWGGMSLAVSVVKREVTQDVD